MGVNPVFKTGPNPPVGFENSGKNVDRAERRRRSEGKRSGILAVGFWFFFLLITLFLVRD